WARSDRGIRRNRTSTSDNRDCFRPGGSVAHGRAAKRWLRCKMDVAVGDGDRRAVVVGRGHAYRWSACGWIRVHGDWQGTRKKCRADVARANRTASRDSRAGGWSMRGFSWTRAVATFRFPGDWAP